MIDKNDYYLLYEITKINNILPSKSDLNFINRVKNNLILKKKYDFNKELFQKIQDKKLNKDDFLKISKGSNNISNTIIKSLDDNMIFDKDSINLVYSLPVNSFVLITDANNQIYLAKINNIITNNLSKDSIKNNQYMVESNNKIIDEIYSSYDLSLNKKYKVKVFNNTLDRIKNNFK